VDSAGKLTAVRILPVLFVAAAAMTYIAWVEGEGDYVLRNMLPLLIFVGVAVTTLVKGGGHWTGAGWRWPLGSIGYAIPALGLTLYLHYGYSVDLDGMIGEAARPAQLFRYLPIYTAVAGAIGFAIGWIAGSNV
jgi:hypothetical protein